MNNKKYILESIDESGTPNMKYYAFDWDDNIMNMPTKIVLKDKDGDEVGMSTDDFARYRGIIGDEEFEYDGHTIVGYSDEPFENFRTKGDKNFIIDSMIAKTGPAWYDFVEAINNGSIFSIITARGHNPETLKEACYNLILSNRDGINSNELIKNLEKYRELSGDEKLDKKDLIKEYLNLCRFYPVSFGEGSAADPEEGKVKALKDFIDHIKKVSKVIRKKAFFKNKVSNNFTPTIGFSDDDIKNVEVIKKRFKDEPMIKTYSTATGIKEPY